MIKMGVDEIFIGEAVVHNVGPETVAIKTNGGYRTYSVPGLARQPGSIQAYSQAHSMPGENIRVFYLPDEALENLADSEGSEAKVVVRPDNEREYSLCLVVGDNSVVLGQGNFKK